MSFAPQLTLSEARDDVLARLGLRRTAGSRTTANDLIDSFIRSSVRQLALETEWVENRRRIEIPLAEDQSDYDWPDDADPGQVNRVGVKDTEGRIWELKAGVRLNERAREGSESSRPRLYEYIDRIIRLVPAPTDTYTHLVVDTQLSPPKLTDGKEVLPFNSEVIVLFAVAKAKRHYGRSDQAVAQAEAERYLERVRRKQGEGRIFNVGGSKPRTLSPSVVNRNKRIHVGRNVPWTEDWNPW